MQDPQPVAFDPSEHALEEVFRHTPVGVVLTDLHGTILDANHAFCSMLGRERTGVVGAGLYRFVHPEEVEHAAGSMTRLREAEVSSVENVRRWIAGDGRTVTTKVQASTVRAHDGEPICGIAFIENIGDRLEMEKALRESEGRYRRVVEDQTELIVRCMPDGVRTFVNEAYCRYAGAPAEELVGKSFFPFIPEDERDAVYRKYAALTPEQPVATEEHRAYARDGSLRWHRWTDRGIFDASGALIEIQAVGRDITDEREAQDQLRRSEESYRRLYSAMPVAVWETDFTDVIRELRRRGLDTPGKVVAAIEHDPGVFFECARLARVLTANDAAMAMTGASAPGDVVVWLRERYTDEAAIAYIRAAASLILGDAHVVDIELLLRTPEGGRIDLLERLARQPGWSTEPKLIAIAIDVTERRRMEREREALARADKMISLGVLVSGVAHEVNNPNHSIMLNISLLREAWRGIVPLVDEHIDEHADEHAAREGPLRIANLPWEELRGEVSSLIDDVEHAAERIRGIVTELRSFALDPDPQEGRAVSMNEVVTSSLRLLGNHVRKATTRFSVALAPDLPAVHGNPRRLEQVLVNLVINACQSLADTSCAISIETGKTGTHVFARVVDEGRGISAEDLRRIKEPFFTTKRTAGGSGLGLAVSERIVQEHGGTLTFESEPGRGTTATMAIPFAP
ncbi:MAG TPA: PAS domain S-box protein [Thermoanaerobaculia bacterium]|nr:PAS domain S-box protein [Thermoanaerobaculia bacterium]